MILTMDVGNTNIKVGLFEGEELKQYFRISTDRDQSSDEYGILLANLFRHNDLSLSLVEGIMISSVVPSVNFTLEHMCQNYFHMDPVFLRYDMPTGLIIHYDNPAELGSDRIANAVAAKAYYGGPCIFIDFGTATTYGVLSARGEFLGGAISPGIKLSGEALVSGAAKLPRVEMIKPDRVIARSTVTNVQSGLIYGYVGSVDYIVGKMMDELEIQDVQVIATGGFARMVADESKKIGRIDGLLTLKGLHLIYEQVKRAQEGTDEAR